MQELVIFFYILGALFVSYIFGSFMMDRRDDSIKTKIPTPPPPPPIQILRTVNNYNEYMVIMGCDTARETIIDVNSEISK